MYDFRCICVSVITQFQKNRNQLFYLFKSIYRSIAYNSAYAQPQYTTNQLHARVSLSFHFDSVSLQFVVAVYPVQMSAVSRNMYHKSGTATAKRRKRAYRSSPAGQEKKQKQEAPERC